MTPTRADELRYGWDVGGAHVKLAVTRGGRLLAVQQWPCPLWLGLDRLRQVLAEAALHWPHLAQGRHALTMTGEMADGFADRRQGVQAIAATLADALGGARAKDPALRGPTGQLQLYAGPGHWVAPQHAAAHWAAIASANWLASAQWAARCVGQGEPGRQAPADGLLIDIGSTTTDLIVLRGRTAHSASRSDADRLASGELVYHGVVRTPLCALGARVPWRGRQLNVMNEFFATSADVHRLIGDLDPRHDQQPAADNGPKTPAATRARLARMIGLDAIDGTPAEWLALARHWRAAQVAEIAGQLRRVLGALAVPLSADAQVVAVGCGRFLVPEVLACAGLGHLGLLPTPRWLPLDAAAEDDVAGWAQVAMPAVAVALLLHADEAAAQASRARGPALSEEAR